LGTPSANSILSIRPYWFPGTWDRHEPSAREGWLCPALFKYFDEAPDKLYARAEPIE
jgi:hypothetical protein